MASHANAVRLDFRAPTPDRISNLPINVLNLILERLPLHDAARTSILSKTWRSIWELQGQLVFDDVFFEHLVFKKHKQAQASEVSATISNILLVHSGPLLKFHLFIPQDLPLLYTDMWIKVISNRGVKILEIVNNLQTKYRMPSHFFSCTELTHLTLRKCILSPPIGFEGFCNLISAELKHVIITADMSFGTQLKTLSLYSCTGIKYLEGQFKCNNNITKLMIFYCGCINWGWFEATRKVKSLALILEERSNSRQNIVNLDKVVGNIPVIQVLFLTGLSLKCLELGASVLKRLTTTMENLLYLQIFDFGFYDLDQIKSLFCLIRSSPKLKNLYITLKYKSEFVNHPTAIMVEQYLQLPNLFDMTLEQFETVDIQGIVGSGPELNFIKHLLASSPSLIWMKLSKGVTVTDPREELRILGEVTRLPRASATAQIIWN